MSHSPNICLIIFSNIYYYDDLLIGVAMRIHLRPDVQTFKDALSELNYKRARYSYLRKLQQQINKIEISSETERDLHLTLIHSIQIAVNDNRIFVASNEYTVYPRLASNINTVVDGRDDIIPCTQCGSSGSVSILEDHDIDYIACPTCNGSGLLTRDFLEKRYQSLLKHQHVIHQSLTELYHKIEIAKS